MKKNNFLSVAFIIIIFTAFVWTIAKQGLITLRIISFDKTDNWQVVEKTNDKILDKINSLKIGLENRVNNYFPFYTSINNIYYNSIINIDSLYLDDIYLKNNRDDEKIFYNVDDSFYYIVNNYSEQEIYQRLNDQIYFFNRLSNKYSNVNFYVYLPLRYELNDIKNIKNLNSNINYFMNQIKKDNLKVDKLEVNSNEEYFKYFYKTDHHYNSNGALKAYNDILSMFNKIDNTNYKQKTVIDNYYGSAAKSLLSNRISDTLTAIDASNTLKTNIDENKFKPLNIDKKSNPFYDYYVGYFDGQYDEVIYSNDNNDNNDNNENLLIISDSLAWQIDYLLANNFNNTYVVNMKYGKWNNENLDLEKYINENKITHVLFLQEAEELMFDVYNYNIEERVK